MVTEVDERNGIVKTYWLNIRDRVLAVEPEFARLVDELDLDKSYPFYLVYFPYGHLKGDTESSFIPRSDGSYYRLNDPQAPSDIVKNLGYGMNHAPLGMVLEKCFEFFIDMEDQKITLPDKIYRPGSFSSFTRNLKNSLLPFSFTSNKIHSTASGVRSTFILPNVGCFTNHKNLKRDLNINSPTPKFLYEHWKIFGEIANSQIVNSDWRACMVYFSKKFVDRLNDDESWMKLNNYLTLTCLRSLNYDLVKNYHEFIYSVIQRKKNLKPNPYLMDTVEHLFAITFGVIPAYSIALNNEYLPLNIIQKAYIEGYGLKNYIPTVMQPAYFDIEENNYPVYYSLQYPSTISFSPKSRKISSKLYEMREIEHIVKTFLLEITAKNFKYSDALLHYIGKKIEFNYFHSERDQHNTVKHTSELPKFDPRVLEIDPVLKVEGSVFSVDSPFMRGCISINTKEIAE